MAAATEKFIRKSSYDTTIHSEDLTASQFAHLTGIDRKRATSICCSSSTTDDDDSDDLESDDDGYSSPHHYSTVGPTVCIWDDHFWQNANNKTLPFPTKEEIVKNECITRTPTCHSVQKGRFKIIWGQQQENYNEIVTVPAPSSKCVEWKRKRANTCDTTFSKKSL
ncbi:uncharacterized protein BX663DRAFT_490625 [Cokeromyces recurvatus]|uniref:uncharacterized protein n=1 Tax=Cokeromyces recurvatus TaxID=90255 RepID=UPI00221F1D64|nr:uncharacterized protein BX663DRAFT_490625 [Cokeromyces recurvatus]KAI7897801.1 hypothetical protein BX663DRAFT_490625 [Cokeromyces recurvatus]